MALIAFVFVAALVTVGTSLEGYNHTIYVDTATGNNTEDCLISQNKSTSCRDLNWVLQQPQARHSSTHFVLLSDKHEIWDPFRSFENLDSLAFTGSNAIVSCTTIGTGLVFINVNNILLQNITFSGCATIQNRSIRYFVDNEVKSFQVGLYFLICENVTMKHVVVNNGSNATGVALFYTAGINSFEHCTFSNNIVTTTQTSTDYDFIVSGGGMMIDASHYNPSETNWSASNEEEFAGSEYHILSCLFDSNEAGVIGDINKHNPYIMELSGFGSGGGLSIFVRHNTSGITVRVDNSMFINNVALAGGGLYVQLNDDGHGNSISVENTHFVSNSCPYSVVRETSGGAIRFQENVSEQRLRETIMADVSRNELIVRNCMIEEGWALKGGGIAIAKPLENNLKDKVSLYLLSNLIFRNNLAKLGAALYLEQYWENSRREGMLAKVEVANCTFENNSNRYYLKLPEYAFKLLEIGIGSIYIYSGVVNFTGNNTFVRNYGTALALSDANALFYGCYAYFLDNVGDIGSAISLFGASTFSVSSGTQMVFENNTATTHGGAIYALYLSRQNLLSDASCFIRHAATGIHKDNWNVSMIFVNNTDKGGLSPNAIYTTSISPCSVISSIRSERDSNNTFCWKGWKYFNSSDSTSESECQMYIDTDVGRIKFNSPDENGADHVKAFPGWKFRMPILAINDYGKDMSKTTIFNLHNNFTSTSMYNWGDMTSVLSSENVTTLITAETTGQRVWYFNFYVDLQPCPPGFVISEGEKNKSCQCADSYENTVYCSERTKEAMFITATWMGDYGGKYYTSICPAGFCNLQNLKFIQLPNNSFDLSEMVCGSNRKGIICGECKDGFGPAINMPLSDCVACNHTYASLAVNIIKYAVSVYVPLGLLFSLLIIFDIRLTAGSVNAFILYSQVIGSTFIINGDGDTPQRFSSSDAHARAYAIPYGIFNMQFIEQFTPSICFSTRMNSLDALLFNYSVAFFPLVVQLLIMILLKVKEYCCVGRCFGKCTHRIKVIHNALLPAFAAFLLLSYSRVSIVSSYLMNTTPLINDDGSTLTPMRLYLAGQYSTHDAAYYYYFIPGLIVFCTFVVTVPLLLLDFPLRFVEWVVSKSSFLTRYYPAIKIHILTDIFQGCYRKNMRCFAGLYFVFRLIIAISCTYSRTWLEQFIIQQIVITFFLILVAMSEPYKRKYTNYIDILIFANLSVINSVSLYSYVYYKTMRFHEEKSTTVFVAIIFQNFLIFLPLIGIIIYFLWCWKYSRFVILKLLIMIAKLFVSPLSSKYQKLYVFAETSMEKTRRNFMNDVSYKAVDCPEGKDDLWQRGEDENQCKTPLLQSTSEGISATVSSATHSSSLSPGLSSPPIASASLSFRRSSSRTFNILVPESNEHSVN